MVSSSWNGKGLRKGRSLRGMNCQALFFNRLQLQRYHHSLLVQSIQQQQKNRHIARKRVNVGAARNSESETISVADVINDKSTSESDSESMTISRQISAFISELDPGYKTVFMTCLAFLICNMDKVIKHLTMRVTINSTSY